MNVVSTESVPLIIMVHVLTTSMVQYDSNINLTAPKSIAMYMVIDYKIQSVECIHKVCKYIMIDKIRRDRKIEKVPIIPLQCDKSRDQIHSCQRGTKGRYRSY